MTKGGFAGIYPFQRVDSASILMIFATGLATDRGCGGGMSRLIGCNYSSGISIEINAPCPLYYGLTIFGRGDIMRETCLHHLPAQIG
jgi:hypothetical protein